MVTNAEIADHLDAMHDLLMERGRCRGRYGRARSGPVCVLGASIYASTYASTNTITGDPVRIATRQILMDRLGGRWVSCWNDDPLTTDDMVFDLLRTTAKELRDAGT